MKAEVKVLQDLEKTMETGKTPRAFDRHFRTFVRRTRGDVAQRDQVYNLKDLAEWKLGRKI